jgi:Carboxypeptidase regulatory-like domain
LAFLAVCTPVLAQINFATASGSVTDAQSQPLRDAHVEVRSVETGVVRDTHSNDAGLFELPNLPPGDYVLTVTATGFASLSRPIRLEVGQAMRLNLQMAVGQKHESIDVSERAELLKTSDASTGEVVETKSIQELPLNGRILLDLAVTVPGAHVSHGAQTGDMNPLYWRPGQPSAISFGGNRPNANYFLVDSVTNTDPTFNTQNISLSPDAVHEFQVQTTNYTADMGGAGGGQINIVTRSGTTQLHGTIYEFVRNNFMDARAFNEMPGNDHLVQNNFGASLGGPLPGKKTFFFANYEGLRMSQAMTTIGTVPTAQEAAGDFSQSGSVVYDPKTSHPNPQYNPAFPVSPANPQILRDPFPNNTIPAGRINPVGFKFMQRYVPQPNYVGGMGMAMGMNMASALVEQWACLRSWVLASIPITIWTSRTKTIKPIRAPCASIKRSATPATYSRGTRWVRRAVSRRRIFPVLASTTTILRRTGTLLGLESSLPISSTRPAWQSPDWRCIGIRKITAPMTSFSSSVFKESVMGGRRLRVRHISTFRDTRVLEITF